MDQTKLIREPRVRIFSTLFDPLYLLFIFTNALAFAIIQTVFFWFVISKQVENTIDKTVDKISDFAEFPEMSLISELYLKNLDSDTGMIDLAKEQQEKREKKNWKLLQTFIFPVIGTLFGLVLICLMSMMVKGERFSSVDLVLLFMIVGAFSTEFVFYFSVIQPMEYTTIAELIQKTIKPKFI